VVDTTITLRLTQSDRALLDELVRIHAERLAREGTEATLAGYVRRLIRRDAAAKGLLRDGSGGGNGSHATRKSGPARRTPPSDAQRTRTGEGDNARRGRP
jgi:hypothetical protein